jgi:hypothetical protein
LDFDRNRHVGEGGDLSMGVIGRASSALHVRSFLAISSTAVTTRALACSHAATRSGSISWAISTVGASSDWLTILPRPPVPRPNRRRRGARRLDVIVVSDRDQRIRIAHGRQRDLADHLLFTVGVLRHDGAAGAKANLDQLRRRRAVL